MASSLSNWEDLPQSGVHMDFGPVTLVAYRTGSLVDAGRGIFFGNNDIDIKPYQDLHDNAPINQYTITAANVVVAPSVMALYPVLFKGKTFQDAVWEEDKKSGFKSSIKASRLVETRVAKRVRSLGHDAIVYTKPPAPARFEIAVIDQTSASIDKTASRSNNMDKTAYISPSTGDLEIDIIRDATPRVVINLDLGIPNFTVFSLKFPLVSEEPKNMAVVVQEALGVLLDEVATFMLSLKFDQGVVTDIYARALSCFAGMTVESSTQADYSMSGQDPTQDTYKGTFMLPQSFVQETQKRVITGASFVKRVPKQRIVEFVKAIPVNKNTIDDAKRTIQMYKNRQLKTQPKPLYVLVYDMNGNASGVLPVDQQWKSKLLRKIQSWQKRATSEGEISAVLKVLNAGPMLPQRVAEALGWDHEKTFGVLQELRDTGVVGVNKMRYYIAGTLGKKADEGAPNEPLVVDQEYNGKGVDTSGTQKFTGVRSQIPPNNPALPPATGSLKQASKAEKNGEIGKEVYDAMEKRCFNLESETDGEAVYERHDGDIRVKVHFNGQEIGDVELNLSGEEDGRWSNGNTHTEHGWEGIQSFTNTYGD